VFADMKLSGLLSVLLCAPVAGAGRCSWRWNSMGCEPRERCALTANFGLGWRVHKSLQCKEVMHTKQRVASSITDLIGNTPLLKLGKTATGLNATILLKLESMEPCSSVKDRLGYSMIHEAELRGEIVPGKTTLVEPTSGNTGIALAMVAAAKGYKLVLTMPESMSMERRVMLKALGAKVVLTPGPKGMKGAVAKAEQLVASLGANGKLLQQFNNPDNSKIHRETTGPEIWEDTDGAIDYFVGGVGTGGTITGCAQYIKPKKPSAKFVALEPVSSPVLSGGKHQGPHKIQGIGAGFVPAVIDQALIDEVIQVTDADALTTARELATAEGVMVGISSGASVWAAKQIAARPEAAGKTIVAIIPSFGERYLSTALYKNLWDEATAMKAEPLEPVEKVAAPA
jgi:cysteine synthase A